MHLTRSLTILATSLFAVTLSAQGQVWRVAPEIGPGIDATEVSEAVALASDGDLILVSQGAYSPFEVDGKALNLQGAGAAIIDQDEGGAVAVTVRNIDANESLTMRGFVVFQFEPGVASIAVEDCAGAVFFEDLFVDALAGSRGMTTRDAAAVSMVWSVVQRGSLQPQSGPAIDNAGIDAVRSNLFLANTSVSGGGGHGIAQVHGGVAAPSDGAPGIRLRGSSLVVAGEVSGGSGGNAFGDCFPAGSGGAGIVVDADGLVPSSVRSINSLVRGGFAGFNFDPCTEPDGANGAAFSIFAGTVDEVSDPTRSLFADSPVAPQTTLGVDLLPLAGDAAFLVIGVDPIAAIQLPGVDFALQTLPLIVSPVGVIGPAQENLEIPTPALPASLGFRALVFQALFFGTSGDVFLSNASRTFIVD